MWKNIFFQFIEYLIRNVPGPVGRKIRFLYYRKRLGSCGEGVVIDIGVIITDPKNVYLGDKVWLDNYVLIIAGPPSAGRKMDIKKNAEYRYEIGELHIGNCVHISPFCVLQAHGGIEIGAKTSVGSGAKVYSLSHHYRNTLDERDKFEYCFTSMADNAEQFLICAPVVIGASSAVGLNTTILPASIVPGGTWIGVQTYISTNDLSKDSIYGSSPAKLLKRKRPI